MVGHRRRLAIALGLTAALLLQLHAAVERDLHGDEAHYARLGAEVGLHGNLLLRGVWNDRPLVFFYLLAPLHRLFGLSDRVSQVPSLVASLLLLLAVHGILRRLHGERAAIVGAGLLALCPLFVAFAPTVFQESTTVAFALLAFWALVAGRPALSGLLYGLAIGTKQLAFAFAPLLGAALLASALRPAGPSALRRLRPGAFWLGGCAAVVLPMLVWSATVQKPRLGAFGLEKRPQTFELGRADFAERAGDWLELSRERLLFDSLPWLAVYGLALVWVSGRELARLLREPGARSAVIERLALHGFAPALATFLALGQLELWDRYAYPLAPTAMATLGVGVDRLATVAAAAARRRQPTLQRAIAWAVCAVALLLASAPALDMPRFLRERLTTRRGGYFLAPSWSRGMRSFLAAPPTSFGTFYFDEHRAGWPLAYYLFDTGFRPTFRSLEDPQALASHLIEVDNAKAPIVFLVTRPTAAEALRGELVGPGATPRRRGPCRELPFGDPGVLFYCP